MLHERLAILIDANGSKAQAEFLKTGKVAERELGKATTGADRAAASMTSYGVKALLAGGVIAAGLWKATEAYAVQERAELKLQNTFDNMPKLAGRSTDGMKAYAAELQKVTTFGDEATIEAMALLGTFQVTEDQMRGMIPLVQDFAAKFDVDLNKAALQVGKALDGQIGALRRNGVSIDENLYKTDRYAAVQQALRDQVGGFAEQEAQTFNGRLQQMKNNLGDVAEVLGKGAIGGFEKILAPVSALTTGLHDMNPALAEGAGGFLAIGSTALIGAGAVSVIVGQVIKAREGISAMRESLMSMSASKAGLIGASVGIAAVAAAVAMYNGERSKMADLADSVNDDIFQGSKLATAERGLEGMKAKTAALTEERRKLREEIDAFGPAFIPINALNADHIRDLSEMETKLAATQQKMAEFAQQVRDRAAADGISEQAAARLLIREQERTEAIEAGTPAEKLRADAVQQTRDAYDEAAKAVKEMNDQVDEYFGRARSVADAESAWQASLDDLIGGLKENSVATGGNEYYLSNLARTIDLTTEQGRQLRDWLIASGDDARAHAQSMLADGASIADASAAMQQHTDALRAQLAQLGLNEQEINNYIATAQLTPKDIATTMVLYDDVALSDIAYAKEQLDSIPSEKRVDLIVNALGTGLSSIFGVFQQRAEGGMAGPGPVRVGERGPEDIYLAGPAYVAPNRGGAPGGGGGQPPIVKVYVGNREVQDIVVDAIGAYEAAH